MSHDIREQMDALRALQASNREKLARAIELGQYAAELRTILRSTSKQGAQ